MTARDEAVTAILNAVTEGIADGSVEITLFAYDVAHGCPPIAELTLASEYVTRCALHIEYIKRVQ